MLKESLLLTITIFTVSTAFAGPGSEGGPSMPMSAKSRALINAASNSVTSMNADIKEVQISEDHKTAVVKYVEENCQVEELVRFTWKSINPELPGPSTVEATHVDSNVACGQ